MTQQEALRLKVGDIIRDKTSQYYYLVLEDIKDLQLKYHWLILYRHSGNDPKIVKSRFNHAYATHYKVEII